MLKVLSDNAKKISLLTHAYGIYNFIDICHFIENPTKPPGFLSERIRHQCSYYDSTYYWLIFMMEILNRYLVFNLDDNVKLYYENYIINPYLMHINVRNEYDKTTMDVDTINKLKIEIFKMNNIFKKHINRYKNTLIQLCINNDISPIRAWTMKQYMMQ